VLLKKETDIISPLKNLHACRQIHVNKRELGLEFTIEDSRRGEMFLIIGHFCVLECLYSLFINTNYSFN